MLYLEVALQQYDDDSLIDLIQTYYNKPTEYTNLLVDQIFPTLEKISKKLISDSVIHNINATTTDLIDETYRSLKNNNPDDSVLIFFQHLRDIIKAILLDTSNHRGQIATSHSRSKIDLHNFLSDSQEQTEYSIIDVDDALNTLKHIENKAYQALSFKLYTASSHQQIATIMNCPVNSVDRYIKEGSKIIIALMNNPKSIVSKIK